MYNQFRYFKFKAKAQASLEFMAILTVFLIVFMVLYANYTFMFTDASEEKIGEPAKTKLDLLVAKGVFVTALGPGATTSYSAPLDFSVQSTQFGMGLNNSRQSYGALAQSQLVSNSSIAAFGNISNINGSVYFR
jgi:hypothetical protein